ncbi:MAG: tetratricopeptide repeat protein [Sphingobium sp.]
MALTPQPDESFLREVDDAVRQDRMLGIWRGYGLTIIASIIGVLALFAGYLVWQDHQRTASGKVAESAQKVLNAIAQKSTPDPKALTAMADASQPGYHATSQLASAAIAVQKGDFKAAAAFYGAMARDEKLAQPYRDLGLVRQVAMVFDQMKPQQVVDTLKPLAVEGGPWFGSAGEMTAIAYMKMGKPELAGPIFAAIAKDPLAPASVRSRAGQMAALLGIDAGQNGAGA